MTWAVALAIIAWPMHVWVSRHVAQPGLAAGLTSVLVVVVILVPGLFVTYQLAREAGSAAERVQTQPSEGIVRRTMAENPALAGAVEWMDRVGLDLDREVRQVIGTYTRDASSLIQGSIAAVLQAAVALFILFHLFRDRAALTRSVGRLLPMTRDEADRVFRGAADSVHANLYACVITSLIDAVSGGLMFWILGLPSPVLWGVVMFVLSILPVVGIFIVWMPASVMLALNGRWIETVTLAAWGVTCGIVVDNLLYVRLAGNRMRLHQVPTLLAFLGGLVVFGASGMILGPAILAVTVAVLGVWHRRAADPDAPPVPEQPPNHQAEPAKTWAVVVGVA